MFHAAAQLSVPGAPWLAYTEILSSERKKDTNAFLERALAWLNRHGVSIAIAGFTPWARVNNLLGNDS